MKKTLFIVLTALLTCAYVNAVEVNDLPTLKTALAAGGEITLTADINAGSTALTVSQGITLKGNGHCVKGTGTYVFSVTTTSAVKFENLVIWSAKTSKAGQGVQIGGVSNSDPAKQVFRDNQNVTFEGVTINATNRGMDILYGDGINVYVNNCTIQNVQGQTVDGKGNPTAAKYDIELTGTNASNTRGINFGHLTNSNITVKNSTLQGFFYEVNNVTGYDPNNGIMEGCKVLVENSSIKGRCALNVWGYGCEYTFTDCNVIGINNYGGSSEGFSCFVFNNQYTCHDNTLTINGGTTVAAVFDAVGGSNPNANQYMVDDRAGNNTIVINNSSYTCTKDLGDDKGGVIASTQPTSDITINGGTYDCPNIVGATYSDGEGNTGTITITGGEFNVNTVAPDMTDGDVYSTIEIEGGTYDIASGSVDQVDPNDPTNTLVVASKESYDNQNGSETVVPIGTNDDTEQKDPEVIKDLVWGSDIDRSAVNVKLQPTQTLTLASGVATANKLDMGQDTKIIVKDGTILTIGAGGVALNNEGDKDPQIVVEAGGKLILHGQMYGSVTRNILIETSESKQGILLFDPEMNTYGDNHPNGTVEFISKSYYNSGSDYQYERFGIPTWNALQSVTCSATGKNTDFYIFQKSWKYIGRLTGGTPFANASSMNTPFVACNLIAYRGLGEDALKYQFAGALNGNANAVLSAENTWTPFANSYTADIDLATLLTSLASGPANIDDAVYLARKTGLGQYTWDAYSIEWLEDLGVTKIVPMQSFCLYNTGDVVESMTLNYKNMVWTPATSPAPAPRRYAADDNTAKLRIAIENEQGVWDNVKMLESSTNARNTVKYMNEDVNFYINGNDNNLAIVTADNIEDTYFGFSTVKGGNFTISFTNVAGREFEFVDLATNKAVKVAEGNTYTFTAAPNTVADYRFKLVGIKTVPTAVDNLSAAKNQTGIYTIMGQYVGEMNLWNTLPAGVYVVNGEKRVK